MARSSDDEQKMHTNAYQGESKSNATRFKAMWGMIRITATASLIVALCANVLMFEIQLHCSEKRVNLSPQKPGYSQDAHRGQSCSIIPHYVATVLVVVVDPFSSLQAPKDASKMAYALGSV